MTLYNLSLNWRRIVARLWPTCEDKCSRMAQKWRSSALLKSSVTLVFLTPRVSLTKSFSPWSTLWTKWRSPPYWKCQMLHTTTCVSNSKILRSTWFAHPSIIQASQPWPVLHSLRCLAQPTLTLWSRASIGTTLHLSADLSIRTWCVKWETSLSLTAWMSTIWSMIPFIGLLSAPTSTGFKPPLRCQSSPLTRLRLRSSTNSVMSPRLSKRLCRSCSASNSKPSGLRRLLTSSQLKTSSVMRRLSSPRSSARRPLNSRIV